MTMKLWNRRFAVKKFSTITLDMLTFKVDYSLIPKLCSEERKQLLQVDSANEYVSIFVSGGVLRPSSVRFTAAMMW